MSGTQAVSLKTEHLHFNMTSIQCVYDNKNNDQNFGENENVNESTKSKYWNDVNDANQAHPIPSQSTTTCSTEQQQKINDKISTENLKIKEERRAKEGEEKIIENPHYDENDDLACAAGSVHICIGNDADGNTTSTMPKQQQHHITNTQKTYSHHLSHQNNEKLNYHSEQSFSKIKDTTHFFPHLTKSHSTYYISPFEATGYISPSYEFYLIP